MENLVVFAAHGLGVQAELATAATTVYLCARIAHYLLYSAGVPVVRPLSFLTGFACKVVIAAEILLA